MENYSNKYLHNHDIDWFCIINSTPIHAASNAGTLPSYIKKNKSINIENQLFAYNCPHIYTLTEIEINKKYIDELFKKDDDTSSFESLIHQNNYLRTFVDMAQRGFYSFDRRYYDKYRSNLYIPIAWPKRERNDIGNTIYNGLTNVDFNIKQLDLSKLQSSLKTYNFRYITDEFLKCRGNKQ